MDEDQRPVILLKEITQLGVVVRDLDKSMQLYKDLLGIEDWAEMDISSEIFDSLTYMGKEVQNARFRTGTAEVGSIQIELIQPVEGDLPYADFLKEHGEGLNHIGHFYVADMETALENFDSRGFPCIFAGSTYGIKFAYVDMTKTLGVILELMEAPKED